MCEADAYFVQTVFTILRVGLVLCTGLPSTPDRQSTFTLIWTVSKRRSPDLAVEETVPLLNKRLLQFPMLALLKPIFARWNQNAKPFSPITLEV